MYSVLPRLLQVLLALIGGTGMLLIVDVSVLPEHPCQTAAGLSACTNA